MANVTETVIITSGTTWTVPYTWNNSNNIVICIGAGAGGGANTRQNKGGGGGGGARSRSNNVVLTPGATITIAIGAAGGSGTSGGDTSFNSGTVVAKGGSTATTDTGGQGGQASAGTGEMKYSGGNGGNGSGYAAGGGGGAAGDTGNGSNGGNANATTPTSTGGAGGNGGATGGATGGAGGAGSTAPGGGGVGWDYGPGVATNGTNYAGAGGGGGGGYTDSYGTATYAGGEPGSFGGGGGGGNPGAIGRPGAIILQWTYQSILPNTGNQISMTDIAVSLRKSPTGQLDLNNSDVRTAFGKASGQIEYNDAFGKYLKPTVVGYYNTTGSGTSPVSLGTPTAGDLAIAFMEMPVNTYPVSYTDGWTLVPSSRVQDTRYGYWACAFYKILQPTDTNFYFYTDATYGANVHVLVLRGASAVTCVRTAFADILTSTLSFTGITKAVNSRALVSFVSDRDPTASGITAPTGWTQSGAASWTYFYAKSAIIDSASYTNGSTITWTNFTVGYPQIGILLEVT